MVNGNGFVALLKDFKQHIQTFIREEVKLVKTEMSEKASRLGHSAISLAIGGFVAYAGLIVLLFGLGALIAFAFENLGLDRMLSVCIGMGIIGVLVIGIGSIMILIGVKAFSKESLTPKLTVETLQSLKEPTLAVAAKKPEDKRTAEQIEASVLLTRNEMGDLFEELSDRVTLRRFRRRADAEIRTHPYKWTLVALGSGLAGSLLLKRKVFRLISWAI